MDVKIVNYSGNGYNGLDDISVTRDAILAIDGSTSVTGIAIIEQKTKGLLVRIRATRDDIKESPVRYKIELKKLVLSLIENNPNIKYISYEEPCIYHKSAIKNLFMLRSFVEELIIENEPNLNYIKHFEVQNTRWKKIFLYPEKIFNNTEADKKAVNEKVKSIYNIAGDLDLNESDSIGLGYATAEILNGEKDFELSSKVKPTKFQYEIKFEDECDTESMIEYLIEGEYSEYKIPKRVLENGIKIVQLGNREKLDNKIFASMQDEDCLLLIGLDITKHGDIAMQYGLSGLFNDYIHAIVWRKTRKKLKEW